MKSIAIIFPVISVVFLILISLNGCTVIGYCVGSAMDKKANAQMDTPIWELEDTKKGGKSKLILQDGQIIQGKFQGIDSLSDNLYRSRCESAIEKSVNESELPCPGDPVLVATSNNDTINGTFLGYDIDYRVVEGSFKVIPLCDLYRVSLKSTVDNNTLMISPSRVTSLTMADGQIIDGEVLRQASLERSLPTRSAVVLRSGDQSQQISVNSIRSIEIDKSRNKKYYLALAGLAYDILFIYLIANGELGVGLEPSYGSGDSWF